MDIYHEILKQYWGYDAFRPLQEDIIHSISEGRDTLGLMPTGGGKSLTFQVPTLAMEGICIVITPLIALMKDQVDNLRRQGIKATAVYSGMTRHEILTQLDNCIFGGYKFLYISPERLYTQVFRAKLEAMQVCLLVVDESHCISQWGYDFRPTYLHIAEIREQLPEVPVLALTATVTPDVVVDIQEKLHFRQQNVFQKSFARENLSYIVRQTEDKLGTLVHILQRIPGTAVVYVRNRKSTKDVASVLLQAGISANFYHAGLNREEKTNRQNRWKNDECRVIVSTNAFGMGIDKPDVRLVVHLDMPGSLEEYYQEAGRAGRDGRTAYAVALCSGADRAKLKKRLSDEFPEKDFILRVYDALGNFYQIAAGYGFFTTHDFSLPAFCAAYHFSMLQTHHALKILELAGYLEYTEDPDNSSRLMFLVTRDELYKMLNQDKKTDEIIQVILRSYTGLFADYVFIDESFIATRCGLSADEVYNTLINLSKYRIINYIPQKKMPQITFTRSREELNYIVIPRSVYEARKERSQQRVSKVLEYITEERYCRARLLLQYLGEKRVKDCGVCDVCLSKSRSGLKNWEFNAIRERLVEALSDGEKAVDELSQTLPFEPEKILRVIRFLVENEEQFVLSDNMLFFHVLNTD